MEKQPRRIVVVSDLHVNSTVGLWPPGIVDYDATPRPQSNQQKWLWKNWLGFCGMVHKFEKPIIVINGDAVQGIHPNRDSQIITTSAATQRRAAEKVLEPLIDGSLLVYVTRGTEFHDDTGGNDIEDIAEKVGAVLDRETGQYSRWELWLEHDGKLFYFTHHIGFSRIYPLTAPQQEIKEAKLNKVDTGEPLPDVQVRSHRHQYSHMDDNNGHHLFVTPSWQLKKIAYVYKRAPLARNDIGGLILWVEDDCICYKAKRYKLPRPNIERVG